MKTHRILFLVALSLLLGGLLSACTGGPAVNSAPGLSANNDTAYLAYHNGVFAIKLADGSQAWRFPAQPDNAKGFYAAPVVSADRIIASDYSNNVYSVNLSDGSQAWTYAGESGHRFVGSSTVVNDITLAPSSDHHLYAIGKDGKLLWKFKTGNILWAAPASDGKLVFLPGMDHFLYALNLSDGSVAWKKDTGSAMQGSPVLGEKGEVYVVPMQGGVYAFDGATGAELWTLPPQDGQVWSTPLFKDNVLYFGTAQNKVFAISTEASASNRTLWSLDLGDPVIASGAFLKDGMIFATENGKAYGVSLKGEKTALALTVNGKLYTVPVVTDNLILLAITQGAENKYMTAFDLNGTEKWSFTPPQ